MLNLENTNTVDENVMDETVTDTTEQDTPPTESLIGRVCDCEKLNIRRKPVVNINNVIEVVDEDTKLTIIEPNRAKGEWYKVVTPANNTGFCMKKFVEIR